jgi:hypothetical protein
VCVWAAGWTALHFAALNGGADTARLLLEHGANAYARPFVLSSSGSSGGGGGGGGGGSNGAEAGETAAQLASRHRQFEISCVPTVYVRPFDACIHILCAHTHNRSERSRERTSLYHSRGCMDGRARRRVVEAHAEMVGRFLCEQKLAWAWCVRGRADSGGGGSAGGGGGGGARLSSEVAERVAKPFASLRDVGGSVKWRPAPDPAVLRRYSRARLGT